MEKNFTIILKKIACDNDEKAFAVLFDHFYPQLFRYAIYYVRQPRYAEEVISDVFYKLLKKKNDLQEIKNIGHYLYRAVKNQSLTFFRDHKKNLEIEPISQEEDYIIAQSPDPESLYLDKENLLLFEEAIGRLPPQRQLIFRLIREEGMNFNEVGELLNISPRTVETHLGLAIKDLCQSLRQSLNKGKTQTKIRKMFP